MNIANKLSKFIYFLVCLFVTKQLSGQKYQKDILIGEFTAPTQSLNYADTSLWAVAAEHKSLNLKLPKGLKNHIAYQASNAVDIFFLYPTIYTGTPNTQNPWLANIEDSSHKKSIAESTLKHQASVFSGLGNLYIPYYRQAHLSAFYQKNPNSKAALDHSYSDLKAAFEQYLKYWNKGRPIIIAGHSQGSYHGMQLIKDFFDEKPLQKQLVFAYLIGYPMAQNEFKSIKLANSPTETNAFASWNTYSRGYTPDWHRPNLAIAASTNPLSWLTDQSAMNYNENLGSVNGKFKVIPHGSNAQNYQGLLWIDKLNIPGAAFIKEKVWHHADYNLFWVNIRENCKTRIQSYYNTK
jgi:hypothetical protein